MLLNTSEDTLPKNISNIAYIFRGYLIFSERELKFRFAICRRPSVVCL